MNHLFSLFLGLLYLLIVLALLFWERGRRSFLLAIRSLWLHKLRLVLSVLGIIIGTAAVISLTAFGEGSMQDALDDIKRQGATNIMIRSLKPPDDSSTQRRTMVAHYGLSYTDYERFLTISTVTRRVPMRIFAQEIRYLERMHNGRVVGTVPEYAEINQLELAAGRFLTEDDDYYMKNVAVLGSKTAERLFPFNDPINQTVRLSQHFYKVVGVLRERMPFGSPQPADSSSGGGTSAQGIEDFNNDVYIPLQTCKVRFGEKVFIRQSGSRSGEQVELSQVTLTVEDMDKVRPAGEVVKDILLSGPNRHYKNDFAVTVPLDRLQEAERAKDRFTRLLVLIASISLVVGGIGIMNIMLATVTERTREIGIRRALGAKRKDITLQFLVEAVVQTNVGGLAGVILGVSLVYFIPFFSAEVMRTYLPAKLDPFSIFLSLGVAVGVGVAFGLYPAIRAAQLDPIEALRHE
jgi:putative ABC transport system permease protein